MLNGIDEVFIMDGNGPYVWSCFVIFILVLVLNIFTALKRKNKILKSLKKL